MQFAPVVQMFDKTKIVADCHMNSVGITARMCKCSVPRVGGRRSKVACREFQRLRLGVNVRARCGFGMRRDEAVNLGRSDSARGAYLDPSELTRLEEPIKR